MNLLKGKNAIITGAGSGIGKETAKLFAKEGCNLVLAGRRKDPLLAVKNEIHERYCSISACRRTYGYTWFNCL